MCVCVCVQLLRCVRLFANPWTVVHQAPLVHGIFQARIFKWVAISFSRGSSQPRNLTCIYCVFALAAGLFTTEPPGSQLLQTLIFIQHGLHLCALAASVCLYLPPSGTRLRGRPCWVKPLCSRRDGPSMSLFFAVCVRNCFLAPYSL